VCGFELLKPAGVMPETEEPVPEILNTLRRDIDPCGFFIGFPKKVTG
jgi:hypothetical protein